MTVITNETVHVSKIVNVAMNVTGNCGRALSMTVTVTLTVTMTVNMLTVTVTMIVA